MLLKSTILNAAVSVTPFVTNGNRQIVPGGNTLLYELCRLAAPATPIDLSAVPEEQKTAAFADAYAGMKLETFEAVQDSIEADLVPLCQAHISFAKNVVNPIVNDMLEKAVKFTEQYKPKDPIAEFEIKTVSFPEVINDGAFKDSISGYKGKDLSIVPEASVQLAEYNPETVLNMFSTGAGDIDELVKKWLVTNTPEFYADVWEKFFGPRSHISNFVELNRFNVFERTNYYLAINLIANHISHDVQDTAISLDKYRRLVEQYIACSAANLNETIKVQKFHNENILVVEKNKFTKKIVVSQVAYKAFLAGGGKPELLLGAIISDDNLGTATSMLTNSDKLLRLWNSYVLMVQSGERNRYISALKTFLFSHFTLGLSTVDPLEDALNKELAIKKAEAFIEELDDNFIDDVANTVLKLVAKCRFYYTSAYDILNDINNAYKINPNIDVREAALVAAINYVADYFVAQLAVK